MLSCHAENSWPMLDAKIFYIECVRINAEPVTKSIKYQMFLSRFAAAIAAAPAAVL